MAIQYYITVEGDDLQIIKKDNGTTVLQSSYQGNQVSMQTNGDEDTFSLIVNNEIVATIPESELAEPATVADLLTLLQTDAYAGPGITVKGSTGSPLYTKVHALQFDHDSFTLSQPSAKNVKVVPKVPINGVTSLRMKYSFVPDGWSAGKVYPATQDKIPQGTWKVVGYVVHEATLALGAGAGQTLQLSIENQGSAPLEQYGLLEDTVSDGGPAIFVDGGEAGFGGTRVNYTPLHYTNGGLSTANGSFFACPSQVYDPDIVISSSGDGEGSFYLKAGGTGGAGTVTAGVFDIEILLKRVA